MKDDVIPKTPVYSAYSPSKITAQDTCPSGKETNIWYMGYSGLDWNQGRPDTISYFQYRVGEGHTSICDRDGNLLLYENGMELYNKNHYRMHSFWYGGSSVMTLLLPQPSNDSLYHLFQPETNDRTGRIEYLYHTVINVLANGGKGQIKGTQKDKKILTSSAERVTAARHCNGKDWWVIGQSATDEQFNVWLLTDQGLSAAPVWTGYSGVYHNDFGGKIGTYGHIKVSHDGNILAEVTDASYIEIHQFDPSTGIISNGMEVMDRSTNMEDVTYCEFSSDNSKLYVSGGDAVYQMDLSNRNQDSIRNSKTVIYLRGAFGVENFLAPIIGPDEKIYFEGGTAVFGPYLAVVHKPNEKGVACQFERKGLKMPHFSNLGSILFPSGMQFPYKAYIYGPLHSCPDTVLRFRLTDACAHEATQWTVLDGAELRSHQGDTIDVYFGQPGVYRIAASYPARCGFRTDTAWVTVSPCACDIEFQWTRLDTVVCKGQDASIIFVSNATDYSIRGQKTGDTILLKNLQKDSCFDITLHYPKYCDSIVNVCVRVEETCIDTCPSGKETNIWYMGYSGLDWNQGRPDTISYFQYRVGEGHTSLCDRDGNLLLYENGLELYNKNHFSMHWFWYGGSSIMTLLLPQPSNDSLYHLFQPETNDRTGKTEYLYHTVINILANGGKGLIKGSQRDRKILAYSGERVTAVRHCNGKDWWVIGQRATDEQYSVWLLTDQGLSAAPVWTGYSGVYHNDYGGKIGTYGHIKVSHDGSTLAEVTGSHYIEIHQFDPATGIISNGMEVMDRSNNKEDIYFCEFSSDNSKLYVSGGDAVYQMDLSNRNQDSIRNSKTVIYLRGTFGVENFLAPIIGPDEKIYFEGGTAVFGPYLAVVHKPNEKGVGCQFERKGLKMPYFSNFGSILFPSGMQFPYKAYIYGPLHSCPDTVLRFRLTDACAHEATQWTVLDGAELRSHQGDTIDVYFGQPGVYRITASYPARCGFRTDTAWVTVSPCACDIEFQWTRLDTVVCKGQDASIIFESNATDYSIHGQKTGDTIHLKNLQKDSCIDITLYYPKYCDSIVTVCVRVAPSWNTKTQHRLCAQDSVFVFDKWEKTSGVVSNLYQSVDGCDSLSMVEIKVSKKDSTLFYHKICRGDTVFAFGKKWTETARVSELLQNSLACPDSLVIHDIFVHEQATPTQQKYFYCYGDTAFYQNNAYTKNEILTEKFQDQNGCDSMHSTEFIFYPKVEFTQEIIYKCTEDSILVNGIYYRDSISLYSVVKNNNGCDSTHTTIVKNFPRLSTIMPTHYICANDSIYLAGAWRKTTGDFFEILNSNNGCDSTIFYSVSVLPNIPLQRNNYSLCAEDSIWISNRWIKNADTIRENFITNQGCDSTILHQVHLIPSIPNTIVRYSICQGDSVSILGKYYYDSIQLVQHLSSALSACDSMIIHQVSLLRAPTRQIEFYICYGDSVIVEGVTINEEKSWTLRKKSNSTVDCDSIIEYEVYFYEDLYVDLPDRIEITEGDSIFLKANYSDNVNQFHWISLEQLSCTDCPDPILKPKASGVYILEVKDMNGCTARDSIQVIVIPNNDPDWYIPNSFSPNGDGINDEWLPVPASSAEIISLSIFSRWGELIYHTKNPCKSWDGNYNNTPQLPGVYVYIFTYKNSEERVVEISGDVSLVR